jgi:hypothetical protein
MYSRDSAIAISLRKGKILFALVTLCGLLTTMSVTAQQKMTLTYYDDGLDCPGGCDAHVVFKSIHNGTKNAFTPPMSNWASPSDKKCAVGGPCIICFTGSADSCIQTIFRGSGPPVGRFDVTPRFLEQHCEDDKAPAPVRELCQSLAKAAEKLIEKTNCIKEPGEGDCGAVIDAARTAYEADKPEYEKCLSLGVKAYNAQQPDPLKLRSPKAGCGYSKNLKEKNSSGVTWQRLLPGACRAGTFVGRWGTDCCTGTVLTDASYGGGECNAFYH